MIRRLRLARLSLTGLVVVLAVFLLATTARAGMICNGPWCLDSQGECYCSGVDCPDRHCPPGAAGEVVTAPTGCLRTALRAMREVDAIVRPAPTTMVYAVIDVCALDERCRLRRELRRVKREARAWQRYAEAIHCLEELTR